MTVKYVMPWIRQYFCVNCKTRLSDSARWNNEGVCYKCGHSSKGTRCATTSKVCRWVWRRSTHPVWKWMYFIGTWSLEELKEESE